MHGRTTQNLWAPALGPVEVASQAGREESQKMDQIIYTMEQYNIKIGALQETKWFGSNAYQIAGSVVLTTVRSIPPSNESRK